MEDSLIREDKGRYNMTKIDLSMIKEDKEISKVRNNKVRIQETFIFMIWCHISGATVKTRTYEPSFIKNLQPEIVNFVPNK